MGIFGLFKKENNKSEVLNTDNGILSPTFLNDLTEHIENPKNLQSHEWRRKLRNASGESKFKIKYYGELNEDYNNLIMETNFAPALIYAVDIKTGEEILLFDGCKHGYNAMFCDTFTQEQIANRPLANQYKDSNGNEVFEITISTYYGIDYEDEFSEKVDTNGLLELIDGTKMDFESVKRNGYDTLQIWATNDNGKSIEMVSEELA
ncbi:hypothetical protein [Maribacter sp. Asnod1-A12]|uniref:hypothetical protein n=1 Tax=Maribacter sp. Asnod1-A12 TaxID=3160576 RepID=UPI00386B6596